MGKTRTFRHYGYNDEVFYKNFMATNLNSCKYSTPVLKPTSNACIWSSALDSEKPWTSFIDNGNAFGVRYDHVRKQYGPDEKTQAILENSYIDFTIKETSKIFEIHNVDDLNKFYFYDKKKKRYGLNFNKMRRVGYAGCELFYTEILTNYGGYLYDSDPFSERYFLIRSWDCDSMVLWDKDAIEKIEYSPNFTRNFIPNISIFPKWWRKECHNLRKSKKKIS